MRVNKYKKFVEWISFVGILVAYLDLTIRLQKVLSQSVKGKNFFGYCPVALGWLADD